jgi:hypothetical protein
LEEIFDPFKIAGLRTPNIRRTAADRRTRLSKTEAGNDTGDADFEKPLFVYATKPMITDTALPIEVGFKVE